MLRRVLSLSLAAMLLMGSWLGFSQPAIATSETTMYLAALPGIGSLFAGKRPDNLGVKDGQLSDCPDSPNCVVSQGARDAQHSIEPLTYGGDRSAAMARLKEIITGMPRTRIIEQSDDYLYAEFESKLMGFIDDVEFYFDSNAGVIQVRSAARLGKSDLGVNRKRIDAIRAQLAAN